MQKFWQTIRSYLWWTHERGSIHYDVMVTLILLFIFLTPRWVFNDKPVQRTPHQTEVVVSPDGKGNLIFDVDAAAVQGGNDEAIRENLLRIIEPISGEIDITDYTPLRNAKGGVTGYRVRVQR